MTPVQNMSRIVVTADNYQDFFFMQKPWQITGCDGEHAIHVGDPYGERGDECQNQISWDHGLYADEDVHQGDSHNQWDEAHAMVLMMRAAPDMLKVLLKFQQHIKAATPIPDILLTELDAAVLRAQTEDEDECL